MTAAALYVALIPLTLICGVLGLASWRRESVAPLARVALLATLAVALVAWIARWRVAAHLPLFGTYESSLSLAVAVLAASLLMRGIASGSAPFIATLLLVQGLAYDRTPYALTISERSLVVDVHALLSWAAFAALTVNFAVAVREILHRDAEERSAALGATLSLGFLLYSAMIATGSLYKFMLFGSIWSFDPIETLALASWLAYAVILHLHLIAKWRARRLAQWCVGIFVLLVVSYRAIILFPPASTYHIFDIDKRVHISGQEVAR